MNRCSKCNNELIAGARFCNICGTPVSKSSDTPDALGAPVGLKRTIQPEIRRVRPPRVSQTTPGSLIPDMTPVESDMADKPAEGADSDISETTAVQEEEQDAPRFASSPVIPQTPAEFISKKTGEVGEEQQPTPMKDTTEMTDRANDAEEVPTSQLPNLPAPPPLVAPAAGTTAQVKPASSLTASESEETVPLPPPSVGPKRTPGIIRPIVSSASLRQNAPLVPGHTPPNPMSPLPNTPPPSSEKPRQADPMRFPRPLNTPTPGSPPPDMQRRTGGPQSIPVPSRQPSLPNIPARQQNRINTGAPPPQPSLHDMPTNYLERPHAANNGNGNGANGTATRQELPLFSPESFAYTSKAAQHWRKSWRDLQNAEAGPAQDVSKGQAAVPAPLASRKDSFIRMRAIRSRQNGEGSEKNFGFWVTLFLMVCLIGGLAAYIVYSYLPNTSVAVRLTQPAGAPQPAFSVVGGPSQAVVSRGQSLRAHGNYFGANDPIQFFLDGTQPVLASTGSPLSVQADSQGSFDVTILAGRDWTTGAHIISATDARANLSAYLDIQVNPDGSPVRGNGNTDLAFSLNGQPIDQLSFTAQLGQSAPPAQRITFTNTTSTALQWTAASSAVWLTILDSDYAGQLAISQPHTMGISVNPVGLSVTGKKPYSGQIVFTINGTTQLTLGVQLTIVNAASEMVFSPNPLIATANGDGSCKPDATLTFINLGASVISWTANPDRQDKIWFVDSTGKKVQQGILQPSGSDADTFVVNLRCSGVAVGQKYTVNVYVNANNIPFTEIVQIGG